MKNYYLDIETYVLYDGTEECKQYILDKSFFRDQKIKRKKEFILGKYYPVLDTNEFIVGGIMDDKEKIEYFTSPQEMYCKIQDIIEENEKKKQRVTFWAHNHEFDFYGYYKKFLKRDITSNKLLLIRQFPLLAIFNKKHYFTDTFTYFPMSLKQIGEGLGYKKEEMPEGIDTYLQILPYLERDIKILKKALEFAKETYAELGYKPRKLITGSSTSINMLMHHIQKSAKGGWILQKGKFRNDNKEVQFIRQASKGGINKAYDIGMFKDCTYIDINSSYWKSMKEMTIPDIVKERVFEGKILENMNKDIILKREGVIQCTIQVPSECDIGVLGIRLRTGNNRHTIHYPDEGQILKGYWTTAEIRFAIEEGYILHSIERAVIYEKNLNFNPLKDFVDKLWALRMKHKENYFKNKFIKKIGNSLYGKFIQQIKNKDFKWIPRENITEWKERGWVVEQVHEKYCISKEREEYIPRYENAIYGVLISAHGRINILRTLKKIKKEKRKYCDTDGIILNGKIPENITIGEEIGEFKIEAEGDSLIKGTKKYYIGDKISISGLRRDMQTKEILKEGTKVNTKQMIGLKECIKEGDFNLLGQFKDVQKSFDKEPDETPHGILIEVDRK